VAVLLVIAGAALSGLLRSAALLVVLALVALALPTSRDLSRRVVVVGAVFLGGLPLLWWLPWPAFLPSHAAVVTAVLGGLLAVLMAMGRITRGDVLPRVRSTDLAGLAAAAVAVWMQLPMLRTTSGPVALTRLLHGWDNSAHYAMAELIRTHGTVIPLIAQGPLGEWSYKWYPQGFHTVVATVSEAVVGRRVLAADQSVALYERSAALVCLLAVVTVVAAVCSLPAVRRRPAVAWPAALLVASVFVIGRGSLIFFDGFPNFFVACAMLALVPLVVAQMTRVSAPLLAALGGSCVAVAQNWGLMIVMAVPAVLFVLLPMRRVRWPKGARAWSGPAAVSLLTLFGMGTAWYQLRNQPSIDEIVVINGGVSPLSVVQLWSTVGLAVVTCLLLAWRAGVLERHRRSSRQWLRVFALVTVPLAGVLVSLAIARVQASHTGSGSYYLVKFEIALMLVSVSVLVAAGTSLVATWSRTRRGVGLPVAALASAAAILVYGWPAPVPTPLIPLGVKASLGAFVRVTAQKDEIAPSPDASTILIAAMAYQQHGSGPAVLLPFPMATFFDSMMAAQWFDGLTGTWTNSSQVPLRSGPPPVQDQSTAVSVALETLARAPGFSVMVGPDFYDSVHAAATTHGWGDRVMTW
jgi:hypothetical protein